MLQSVALFVLAFQPSLAGRGGVSSPPADDLTVKLNQHIHNYNLGMLNFVDAFIRVSSDFQIPMGVTFVNSPSTRAERAFAWKDATVFEIIRAIAKTQPDYQVQVENGVVHVFPVGVVPDRQNFLKLKFPSFEAHNTMVEVMSFKLHMLVTPIKGSYQVSVAGPGDAQVSIQLKNCTVQDILDALAVASNRKVWIVMFSGESNLMANGLRRTCSLFTDAGIRDEEQPVWYLHRLGDPLPPILCGTLPMGATPSTP